MKFLWKHGKSIYKIFVYYMTVHKKQLDILKNM